MSGEALEQEAWSLTFLKKSAENIFFNRGLPKEEQKRSKSSGHRGLSLKLHWRT